MTLLEPYQCVTPSIRGIRILGAIGFVKATKRVNVEVLQE